MKKTINVLFIGDIVGKPGRRTAKLMIPKIKEEENIDYVFANGENLAAGKGITLSKYHEMIDAGVDYFTTGNHVWNNSDIIPHLNDENIKILRPYNYPNEDPGRGLVDLGEIVLVNLQGRVFMDENISDPFTSAKDIAREYKNKAIIIDFHAEATSEKIALAYYLDGEISALLGTHTHVQTADEKILEKGTGFISDVGMTGPYDSVLGVQKEIIIEKFLTQLPASHKIAVGDTIFSAIVISIDSETKMTTEIKRIYKKIDKISLT